MEGAALGLGRALAGILFLSSANAYGVRDGGLGGGFANWTEVGVRAREGRGPAPLPTAARKCARVRPVPSPVLPRLSSQGKV